MEILWKDIFANAVKMKFLILVKDVVCMLFEHAGKNKKYCKNYCLTVEVSQ